MGEKGMEASSTGSGGHVTVGGVDPIGATHTTPIDPAHLSGTAASEDPPPAAAPPPPPSAGGSPSVGEVVEEVLDPIGVHKLIP